MDLLNDPNLTDFFYLETETDSIFETLCFNYYLIQVWDEGGSPNSAIN
jgi:hypothetical protein